MPQHFVEVVGAGDREVCPQQTPQAPLGGLDLAGVADELVENLVELQARRVREAQPGDGIVGRNG